MTEDSAAGPSSNKPEDTQSTDGTKKESKEQAKEEVQAEDDQKDTREDWEVQRDSHKKDGDDAFRAGDCGEAIKQYTNALSVDPTNHLVLSNRSAANLKQGNKSKALQDARACIDAEPSFVKGHSRLAAALQSLGRYQPAKSAYSKVLELDANNQIAKKGMQDCTDQLRIQEQEELKRVQEELRQKTEEEEKKKKEGQKESTKLEADNKTEETGGGDDDEEEEDDLLNDFFSEVETAATKPKVKPKEEAEKESSRNNIIRVQKKDLGTSQSQIDRLLVPHYEWRNLNPFLVMDLPHTASEDDISKRYKALSLLLHPDKCRSLSHAKEAYDEVQRAKKTLDDEHKGRHARQLVEQGMKVGQKEWRANGEKESLEDLQSRATQKIFAEIENKRREIERREQKQEQRERQQEEEELKKEKDDRQFDKKWREDNRVEKRIGNWRDFKKKGSSKKQRL